jgi:hypothetical protein
LSIKGSLELRVSYGLRFLEHNEVGVKSIKNPAGAGCLGLPDFGQGSSVAPDSRDACPSLAFVRNYRKTAGMGTAGEKLIPAEIVCAFRIHPFQAGDKWRG